MLHTMRLLELLRLCATGKKREKGGMCQVIEAPENDESDLRK